MLNMNIDKDTFDLAKMIYGDNRVIKIDDTFWYLISDNRFRLKSILCKSKGLIDVEGKIYFDSFGTLVVSFIYDNEYYFAVHKCIDCNDTLYKDFINNTGMFHFRTIFSGKCTKAIYENLYDKHHNRYGDYYNLVILGLTHQRVFIKNYISKYGVIIDIKENKILHQGTIDHFHTASNMYVVFNKINSKTLFKETYRYCYTRTRCIEC